MKSIDEIRKFVRDCRDNAIELKKEYVRTTATQEGYLAKAQQDMAQRILDFINSTRQIVEKETP